MSFNLFLDVNNAALTTSKNDQLELLKEKNQKSVTDKLSLASLNPLNEIMVQQL